MRPALLLQFGIAFVIYRLQPLVAGLFAGHFHGNVAEPAAGLGTVPVLDLRRNHNDRAGREAYGFLAFLLVPALACGANKNLPAARFGMVDMPIVAAARLKGDVCQAWREGSDKNFR